MAKGSAFFYVRVALLLSILLITLGWGAKDVLSRPVSATETKPIDSIEDLAVGPTTAAEIGWSRAP